MKILKTWSLFLMTFVSLLGFAQNDPMIFRINFPVKSMPWSYNGIDNFHYTTQKVGETKISETKTGTTRLEVDAPGEYLVSIVPPSSKVTFNYSYSSNGIEDRVLELLQWGDIQWASMQNLFKNHKKLTISATDIPDTSSVKDFSGLFQNAQSLTEVPNIDTWDTDQVTNMSYMFYGASVFNQPLAFNTSSVIDMGYMFFGASAFNQPLDFDTSNVINMQGMFSRTTAFNQPLSFVTSKVTDMSMMFSGTNSFNQPLTFDTSMVTDMGWMFSGALAFNESLTFNTSKVTSMSSMFNAASVFNQPLNFDTNSVIDMQGMFGSASSFNQPLNFDTSNVTDMSGMFALASAFNQPLNFDTGKVTNMWGIFYEASAFNHPLTFDTSNVVNMALMFSGASSFNQPLPFDTSKVVNMQLMFSGASSFNQPLPFDTSKVTNMANMFFDASAFNQDIGHFQLASIVYLIDYALGSGIDCNNYSKTLKGWASQPNLPLNGSVNFGSITYGKNGETYRDQLIAKGWIITDGGLNEACDDTLSLGPIELNKKVALYPNPTSDVVYFTTDEASDVKIFSAEGQLVKSLKSNVGQNAIDVSYFGKGIYFITIGNQTQKLIKN